MCAPIGLTPSHLIHQEKALLRKVIKLNNV